MITLTQQTTKRIIQRLINGQDYRKEVIALINAEFLEYTLNFFRRIVDAKLRKQEVTSDWYQSEFLSPEMPSSELVIHAGLNEKTVSNMYNSARREVVLEASLEHYRGLYELINELLDQQNDVDIRLTIKLNGVSVELSMNESLIVINTLAVKRAQLRGGAWSTAGKQVEKMLMQVLCKLYSVPEECYAFSGTSREQREIDFYLIGQGEKRYFCEVKLMGKGNPESADATIARESDIFVADKLSNLNKEQLTRRGIRWVELRSPQGYQKFQAILEELNIPHRPFFGNLDKRLEEIFEMFS